MTDKMISEESSSHFIRLEDSSIYMLGAAALAYVQYIGIHVSWDSFECSQGNEVLHLELIESCRKGIIYAPSTAWYNSFNGKEHAATADGKKDAVCEFVEFIIDPDNYYLIEHFNSSLWKKLQPLMEAHSLAELELKLSIFGF